MRVKPLDFYQPLRKWSLIIFFLLLPTLVFSQYDVHQDIVSSTGGYYQQENVSLSWTIGEISIETYSQEASNVMMTQGFHQSKFTITALNEPLSEGWNIKVFPNPVTDLLYIDLPTNITHESLYAEIYDLQGRKIYSKEISQENLLLDIRNFATATYLLRLYNEEKYLLKTFKVLKSN